MHLLFIYTHHYTHNYALTMYTYIKHIIHLHYAHCILTLYTSYTYVSFIVHIYYIHFTLTLHTFSFSLCTLYTFIIHIVHFHYIHCTLLLNTLYRLYNVSVQCVQCQCTLYIVNCLVLLCKI